MSFMTSMQAVVKDSTSGKGSTASLSSYPSRAKARSLSRYERSDSRVNWYSSGISSAFIGSSNFIFSQQSGRFSARNGALEARFCRFSRSKRLNSREKTVCYLDQPNRTRLAFEGYWLRYFQFHTTAHLPFCAASSQEV